MHTTLDRPPMGVVSVSLGQKAPLLQGRMSTSSRWYWEGRQSWILHTHPPRCTQTKRPHDWPQFPHLRLAWRLEDFLLLGLCTSERVYNTRKLLSALLPSKSHRHQLRWLECHGSMLPFQWTATRSLLLDEQAIRLSAKRVSLTTQTGIAT